MPVPPAELDIDEALVRGLLAAQHPDLAELPLTAAGYGWDNAMWRLGDELAVRIPRRQLGAELMDREQRWLPDLAPRLPTPVPAPMHLGRPSQEVDADATYPWPWSVVPWFTGETADARPLGVEGTRALGSALHALHVRAPKDAPVNPFRGIPLSERPDPLPDLDALYDGAPPRGLGRVWRRALAAPDTGWRTWTHGDLHARNLLVAPGGRLAAIIDWGDLGVADPAVDLSALWTVLDPGLHGVFCSAYGPVEGTLLERARGWALVFAAIFASLDDDPGAVAIGRRTLERLQG